MKKLFFVVFLVLPIISIAKIQKDEGTVHAVTRTFKVDLEMCKDVFYHSNYSGAPRCYVHYDFKEKKQLDQYVSGTSLNLDILPNRDDPAGLETMMKVQALKDGFMLHVYSKHITKYDPTIWDEMAEALKVLPNGEVKAFVYTAIKGKRSVKKGKRKILK